MNFEWKKLADRGQDAIGYVDIYELQGPQKAVAIIYYLPQHSEPKQRVILTLLLEGEKRDWTEGTLSSILEDAEHRIKSAEGFKFVQLNVDPLNYIDTQIFTLKKIEDFALFNYGDYSFPGNQTRF